MNKQMQGIWEKVREKQALEAAAQMLCEQSSGKLALKLAISAIGGLLVALLPAVGAAQILMKVL